MDNTINEVKQNISDQAQQKGHEIMDKITDSAHKAEDMLKQASQQVQQNASNLGHAVCSYVKEKPFTALAFAVLAGSILGAALRGK